LGSCADANHALGTTQVVIVASVEDGHFGLWLRRWLRIPFVVFAYGNEILETIQRAYPRQQQTLRVANLVLASSRYTAELAQRAGADPARVKVLWPGCDSEFFRPMVGNDDLRRKLLGTHYGDRVILTVGNLVSRKGQDMVIRALPDLCRRVPDVVYLIAGGGPYRGELEKLAMDLGVLDRIVFAGRVSDEDLPDLYALCEVFVMVSRARIEENDVEGFGIVLLEASACGKPVIGGQSGGVADALADGVSGLLVDPLSQGEITEALARLLTDGDLAKRLGEQGRSRVVNEFQWGQRRDELLDILKAVHSEGVIGNLSASFVSQRALQRMDNLTTAKDDRTLCIVLPYAPAPSETFISNHIEYLPARIVTVEGWRPSIDGRTVLSLAQRISHKLLRTVTGRGLERETTAAYVKAFRQHRVAAVLAEYGTTGVMTVDACRQLNIPLIVYFFGYDASVTSVLESMQSPTARCSSQPVR